MLNFKGPEFQSFVNCNIIVKYWHFFFLLCLVCNLLRDLLFHCHWWHYGEHDWYLSDVINWQDEHVTLKPLPLCFSLVQELYSTMECLENIFTKAYQRDRDTNGVSSTHNTVLHVSALLAWTLLLTICPMNEVKKKIEMWVSFLKSRVCNDCLYAMKQYQQDLDPNGIWLTP